MGCGASSAPKAEDEPPVRASESIDHAATRVSASKSADAKPLEETVDEKDDWSEVDMRKDQRKYLCGLESAKGKNPTTGVETRDSLACPD